MRDWYQCFVIEVDEAYVVNVLVVNGMVLIVEGYLCLVVVCVFSGSSV